MAPPRKRRIVNKRKLPARSKAVKKPQPKRTPKKPRRRPKRKQRTITAEAPVQTQVETQSFSTQVSGREIDDATDAILNKSPLQRFCEAQLDQAREECPTMLISGHFLTPKVSDFEEDSEKADRNKMYWVPPKPKTPPTSSEED